MGDAGRSETLSFQTEVKQLLHLMIHSLYSHKEIFIRELVSNASDACDRLRFLSLTDAALAEDVGELEIRIEIEKDARTVTISDNGIGMDREEVVANIGTIARSGTQQFVSALTGDQKKDAQLIGQFGVGFYSAFMVADRVVLETRRAGGAPTDGVRWESDGSGEFTIEPLERAERGTRITLHLREGEDEFLDAHRVREILRRYSDNISLPIRMRREADKNGDADEWETVNKGTPLWARPRQEVSADEYADFYRHISYDSDEPLFHLHNKVEGKLEYTTLFYVPKRAPFDLWDRDHRHGVKLYVRRVFIMDDTKFLMPAYLRFVRGVVDSADLPLNVSREFLQHNREIDSIRSASTKRLLGALKAMAEDEADKYTSFWEQFGRALKEGIVEDPDNRETIASLLRFATTRSEGAAQNVSLDDYVKRMPMKQKAIYYLTGESHAAVKASPHLEVFRKSDVEVLLLSDPVDEWVVNHLTEYSGKPLRSVAKGALDLDDVNPDKSESERKKEQDEYQWLTEAMAQTLSERVKGVRLSDRLIDSPACLVADDDSLGQNMERILQALGQDATASKPYLEINPDHPIIRKLDARRDELEDWAWVLFDQATLAEGAPLTNPAAYVRRVNALLATGTEGEETTDRQTTD